MSALPRHQAPSFALCRKRRSFGLDAPRPPDLARTEAAIADWLAGHVPEVFWLRVAPSADRADDPAGTTLVLMLPGGRIAVLRIEVRPRRIDADTLALVEQCRARRIPLGIVRDVDEVRAALRRFGVEPEEA